MQIHGADPVIVRPVSAAFAAEEMDPLVPVRPFRMAAFWTGLACIGTIDFLYKLMVP